METGASFAVAMSLGARRAAALIRIDDLVSEEHSLAEGLRGDNRTLMRTRERDVMHAAIEAAAEPAPAR
jgi:hypothetical protein